MLQKENSRFMTKKHSNSSKFFYLELGFYLILKGIVEATNTLIQERHNNNESCITVKVSRRTQKFEIYLEIGGPGIEFFETDLGHFCLSNDGNEFGAMLKEKGHHKREVA